MSTKLEIGDKVKLISRQHGDGTNNPVWGGIMGNVEGTIKVPGQEGRCLTKVDWDNGKNNDYYPEDLELISTKRYMKSIKEWLKDSMRTEPERSFVRAGIMDEKEELTSTGKELLLEFFLKENKEKFNTDVVQPYLAAQDEADKTK